MSLIQTPGVNFNAPAPDFKLLGTDGNQHALADLRGDNGTLVVFICNHCPFVIAVLDRMARDARDMAKLGINTIAINPNDAAQYPEDSFPNMVKLHKAYDLPFPYLYDETQSVARDYDAQCTPDFFGYNADLKLQYRGRIDASRMQPAADDAPRELFDAMTQIAKTGTGPVDQVPSMGCSIKWAI